MVRVREKEEEKDEEKEEENLGDVSAGGGVEGG